MQGEDASVDAPTQCPAQVPVSGDSCQGELICAYGQSTCCGITSPAWTCTCRSGSFLCAQTVECNIICASPDGGARTDASPDGGGSTVDVGSVSVGAACGGTGDPPCASGTYCEWSDNMCGTRTHGACASVPMGVACVISSAPVCGCDGKNYPGACEASKAGVDVSSNATCPEPANMFRCGWSYCQHSVQYCHAQVGGAVTNPGVYTCTDLPAACGGVSTCACVTGSSSGCTTNPNVDVTVTIAVP